MFYPHVNALKLNQLQTNCICCANIPLAFCFVLPLVFPVPRFAITQEYRVTETKYLILLPPKRLSDVFIVCWRENIKNKAKHSEIMKTQMDVHPNVFQSVAKHEILGIFTFVCCGDNFVYTLQTLNRCVGA